MIALLAAAALAPDVVVEGGDMDRLAKAAAQCDRAAVGRAWDAEVQRHSGFVLQSYKDEAALIADRRALADRRRKSRTPSSSGGPAESEAALTAASAELDDRQRALDDGRRLDQIRQDTARYFRQAYLTQCNGRDQ